MANVDLKAEMLKVYEDGNKEIDALKEQIKEKKEALKGAKAYLVAIGAIQKQKRSPRKPKE